MMAFHQNALWVISWNDGLLFKVQIISGWIQMHFMDLQTKITEHMKYKLFQNRKSMAVPFQIRLN